MTIELDTKVGQLEVAQGQRRNNAPNARAVEPGNTKGNLYLLLELEGPEAGKSRLTRQVLSDVQTTFYAAPGNVADVLHKAVSQAHTVINQANASRAPAERWRGGISCVALWRDHVYLAQAGPALVMVTHPATVEMFPAHSDAVDTALGDDEAPMVDLYHTRIEPDNVVLLLQSGWAARADVETLASAATAPDIGAALGYLADIAGNEHLTALAVGTQLVGAPAPQQAPKAAAPLRSAGGTPAAAPSPPPAAARPRPAAPEPNWWQEPAPELEPEEHEAGVSATLANAGEAVLHSGRTLFERMLPDAPAERVAAPPPPAPPPQAAAPRTPRARPSARPASRSRVPIILALVIIPLAILVLVGVMYWVRGRDREQRFQSLVGEAQAALNAAPGLDEGQARLRLTDAQSQLNEALTLKPGDNTVLQMQSQIDGELNRVNHVVPLYLVAPLKEFDGSGRDLSRVLVDGSDVFVLDRGRDTVERYRLNALGDGLQPDEGGVIIERGKAVGSLIVGELVDMVWAPPVGPRTDSALLILDANGVLYEYRAPWELKARSMAMHEMWQRPQIASTYAGNFYLLDSSLQQILRYKPGNDLSFSDAPEQYFPPETPVDLTGAVDMGIDGSVWVLLANGTVDKYLSGKAEQFGLQNLPQALQRPSALFVGIDGGVAANNLYIADGGAASILQFDKNGVFTRQFREADGEALQGLRSLFVDEAGAYFFLLTGTDLYKVDIPR